jgi:hypothetical protein
VRASADSKAKRRSESEGRGKGMPKQPRLRDKRGRFTRRPVQPPKPPLDPAFVAGWGLVRVAIREPSNILEELQGRKVIDGR